MMKVIREAATKRIPDREFRQTKNYLKGTYILDHQTNSQRAHYLGWWEILGLGAAYDRTYVADVDRAGAPGVLRAAESVFARPPITVEIIPRKTTPATALANGR
jgi:zinc protease